MKKRTHYLLSLMLILTANADSVCQLSIQEFATGLSQPVDLANAGDGSNRLFVVEKSGRILVLHEDGLLASEPFLDIRSKVDSDGGEEGLLGLVFHPDYVNNG